MSHGLQRLELRKLRRGRGYPTTAQLATGAGARDGCGDGALRILEHRLHASIDAPRDCGDGTCGRGIGRTHYGAGGGNNPINSSLAFGYRRDQWLYPDRVSDSIRPGPRWPFPEPLRKGASAIRNPLGRHCRTGRLDWIIDPHRIIRDAISLHDAFSLDLLYAECCGSVGVAPQTTGCTTTIQNVGLSLYALVVRDYLRVVHGRRPGEPAKNIPSRSWHRGLRHPVLLHLAQKGRPRFERLTASPSA